MQLDSLFTYDSVALNAAGDGVVIVDQTLLPGEERFLTLRDEHEVYEAIVKLRVRGAPAIGIAAAYGLYMAFRRAAAEPGFDIANARDEFYRISRYLCSARPTAVNLSAALRRMERRFDSLAARLAFPELLEALRGEAEAIKAEDMAMCRSIGALCCLQIRYGIGSHISGTEPRHGPACLCRRDPPADAGGAYYRFRASESRGGCDSAV